MKSPERIRQELEHLLAADEISQTEMGSACVLMAKQTLEWVLDPVPGCPPHSIARFADLLGYPRLHPHSFDMYIASDGERCKTCNLRRSIAAHQ